MEKINILFVGNLKVGGSELYLNRLIRTIDRKRFRVTVALLRAYGLKEKMPNDVELILMTDSISTLKTAWKNWILIFRFAKLMKSRKIDIVHSNHLAINSMYAQAAAKMLRIPTIETLQHAYNARSRTDDVLIRNPVARAIRNGLVNQFISLGEVYFNELNTMWKIPVSKLFLNKMGVDTNYFRPFQPEMRQHALSNIGIRPDSVVLGFIGRPNPVKGLNKVLHLVHHLIVHLHNVVLVVIGIEQGHADYEKQIRELKIEKYVVFCGLRADIPFVISGMDWYIQATDGPSLGNTTLECMACGKPIATFYSSEHEKMLAGEACREGINGTLLNLHEIINEAERFSILIKNKEQCLAMGMQSRKIAEKSFSQRNHTKRMAEFYKTLVKKGSRP